MYFPLNWRSHSNDDAKDLAQVPARHSLRSTIINATILPLEQKTLPISNLPCYHVAAAQQAVLAGLATPQTVELARWMRPMEMNWYDIGIQCMHGPKVFNALSRRCSGFA
jgi:hypothetical protein